MTNTKLSRYGGWSALASAIASIVGLVTLIMLFTLGQPWGTINDIASVVQALSILPVLLVLHRLYHRDAPTVSLAAFSMGVLGMLVAILFQTLLIIGVITFTQTAVISPLAFGLLGIPLMFYGNRAYVSGTLPRGLALLSLITGAGFVALIAGVILGGQEHPLTAIGGLIAAICYPIWATWFGRILLSGRLTT
jgi:hypothetical protein